MSGAGVARLYHRLLAIIFLIAWASLGVQVDVLIGSHGLLPAAPFLAAAHAQGIGLSQIPTVFWLDAGDGALRLGIWIGAALSAAALFGFRPRLCTGLATVLYLSYASASRTFLSFQWDNLLLECGALAVFLPTDRPARWIHVLFRVLLFKLYWESGIAKWQSHLGDWQDGSAMTFYYETAPLPTLARLVRPPPAGLVAPSRELGRARSSSCSCRSSSSDRGSSNSRACGIFTRLPTRQPGHGELRLLRLSGAGAARVPAQRSRCRAHRCDRRALGAACAHRTADAAVECTTAMAALRRGGARAGDGARHRRLRRRRDRAPSCRHQPSGNSSWRRCSSCICRGG